MLSDKIASVYIFYLKKSNVSIGNSQPCTEPAACRDGTLSIVPYASVQHVPERGRNSDYVVTVISQGRITAAHLSLSRICQVAPICTA